MKNQEKKSGKTIAKNDLPLSKAEEPLHSYKSVRKIPEIKDFTFAEFRKTADKVPFTLIEWAAMLHVSERTLQRYAKNNGKFASINAERFHQISDLIARGKKVLGKANYFYEWIHSNPPSPEGDLSFASLTSFEGIQKVLRQLGRIEHGILA